MFIYLITQIFYSINFNEIITGSFISVVYKVAGLQTRSSKHKEAVSSQIKAVPEQDPVTVVERIYDI